MSSIVILTGGIGSGKSVVAAMLRDRGIPVYDSDSRTKALYDSDPGLVPALEEALGLSLRSGADVALDRRKLASIIFNDSAAREKLEDIVYPHVLQDFLCWKDSCGDVPFVVLESAVILSKPAFAALDARVVLVRCDQATRLSRVMRRDGSSAPEALARIGSQSDVPEARADIVIDNSGSLEDLRAAVDRLLLQLCA